LGNGFAQIMGVKLGKMVKKIPWVNARINKPKQKLKTLLERAFFGFCFGEGWAGVWLEGEIAALFPSFS
jgi:hypothetical protein